MRRSGCAVAALVFGCAGVAVGWLPVVGRFVSLACGALAVALGVVGMRRSVYGEKGSGHRLAVAGLTLGAVCLFQAVRGFGCTAAGTALTGLLAAGV